MVIQLITFYLKNLQKIDISKIVCDNCNKNKSDSYNYQFYTCTTCNNNFQCADYFHIIHQKQ